MSIEENWFLWGRDETIDRFYNVCMQAEKGCVMRPYALSAHRALQEDLYQGRPTPS